MRMNRTPQPNAVPLCRRRRRRRLLSDCPRQRCQKQPSITHAAAFHFKSNLSPSWSMPNSPVMGCDTDAYVIRDPTTCGSRGLSEVVPARQQLRTRSDPPLPHLLSAPTRQRTTLYNRLPSRTLFFSSEKLIGSLSVGRFDYAQRRLHRPTAARSSFGRCLRDHRYGRAPRLPREPFVRLDTMALVRVKRAYDRDEKRCATFCDERRPSEALTEARSRQLRRSLHYGDWSCTKGFGPSSGSDRACVRAHWHQRSAILPRRLGLAYPRASAGSEVDDTYPLTSSSSSSPSASRPCLPPYRPRSTFAQLRRLSTIELHSRPSLSPACRQRAWP